MKYRAVLFDLFGTLVPAFPEDQFNQSAGQMAFALGIDPDVFRQAWSFETWDDRATGVFETVEANLMAICGKLGVQVTRPRLALATEIRVAFTRAALRPRSDAIHVLDTLKSRSLRLALVSDCSAEVPALWSELALAPYFETTAFSCRVGEKKPHPRIYETAYQPLGVQAGECVYVGDGFSQELAGARSLGMRAILIAPPGEISAGGEAASWDGDRIRSLTEALGLIVA